MRNRSRRNALIERNYIRKLAHLQHWRKNDKCLQSKSMQIVFFYWGCLDKFGWRSNSCQQAPSLKEMFFPSATSQKRNNVWFCGFGTCTDRTFPNISHVHLKNNMFSDMTSMTSHCWPCNDPPKKRSDLLVTILGSPLRSLLLNSLPI